MEDTLREINNDILDRFNVLILVLMEDTLRGLEIFPISDKGES